MAERTCAVEGCNRHAKVRGWCQMHYQRWHRTGDVLTDRVRPASIRPVRQCAVDGCGTDVLAKGMCSLHYQRWSAHGDPLYLVAEHRPAVCSISDCERPRVARGWCQFHWQRWRKHGDPLAGRDKTVPNRHEVERGSGVLIITRRDGTEVRCWYDLSDHGVVSAHQWYVSGGYVARNYGPRGHKGLEFLHRRLLGLSAEDPELVDHISGNRGDNRRANLRRADAKLNGENRAVINELGTSKYRGVCWDKSKGKWKAYTRLDGVMHNIGFYPTEDEAADAISAYRSRLQFSTGYPRRHPGTPSRSKRAS